MTFLGADTDQLRETASAFERGATSLETLLTSLSGVVGAVDWQGPDADGFRSDFDQLLRQALTTTGRVSKRATALEEEAEEQDEASGGGGADGAGGQGAPNPLDGIRRIFDGLSGPGGPADPDEKMRKTTQEILTRVAEKVSESVGENKRFPGWLRTMGRRAPLVSAIPDLYLAGEALMDGDTGGVIGHGAQAFISGYPHPAAGIVSQLNSLTEGHLPGDSSWIEFNGDIATRTATVRSGESLGAGVSHLLGFDTGSTGSNVLTSGYGAGSAAVKAVSNPFGFAGEHLAATAGELLG